MNQGIRAEFIVSVLDVPVSFILQAQSDESKGVKTGGLFCLGAFFVLA
jgi:hypothetical protein